MLHFLIDYAGRLHPLVIHFPIALLLVGAAGEAVRLWLDQESVGRFVQTTILLGAIGVLIAASTGWLFAYQVHPAAELKPLLLWHRWLGVAAISLAGLAAWAADRWAVTANPRQRWLRRGLVWAAAALGAATAHLGALLVWGTDFFS